MHPPVALLGELLALLVIGWLPAQVVGVGEDAGRGQVEVLVHVRLASEPKGKTCMATVKQWLQCLYC